MSPHTNTAFDKTYTPKDTSCLSQAKSGDQLVFYVRPGKAGSGFKLYITNLDIDITEIEVN